MIISEKTSEKKILLVSIADTIMSIEVTWPLNPIDFAKRCNWIISNANLDKIQKLGLIGIKKYLKCIGQVEIKLD